MQYSVYFIDTSAILVCYSPQVTFMLQLQPHSLPPHVVRFKLWQETKGRNACENSLLLLLIIANQEAFLTSRLKTVVGNKVLEHLSCPELSVGNQNSVTYVPTVKTCKQQKGKNEMVRISTKTRQKETVRPSRRI